MASTTLPLSLIFIGLIIAFLAFVRVLTIGWRAAKDIANNVGEAFASPDFGSAIFSGKPKPLQLMKKGKSYLICVAAIVFGVAVSLSGAFILIAEAIRR
jgi:hypothetical protein